MARRSDDDCAALRVSREARPEARWLALTVGLLHVRRGRLGLGPVGGGGSLFSAGITVIGSFGANVGLSVGLRHHAIQTILV